MRRWLRMRHEQRSAFAHGCRHLAGASVFAERNPAPHEIGRFANLGLLLLVLILAALWLAFPPAQLSSSPPAGNMLAQDAPPRDLSR
jgi:hypothetical protein